MRTRRRGGGSHGRHLALAVLSVCAALWLAASTGGVPAARAQAAGVDPLALLLTAEDAGEPATLTLEEQGDDGQASWAHRRWERDRDSPDATSGPLVLANVVFVARDLAAARQLYAREVGKQASFPEAVDRVTGPYPFPMMPIGDESAALSGCDDCLAKHEIYVHHRAVIRKGPVVTVVYTYGTDTVATQELATWFAGQAAGRIPDGLSDGNAAGGAAPGAGAPAGAAEEAAQAAPPAEGPAPGQAQAPAAPVQAVQARPQDLVVRREEAGKGAELKDEADGSDDRSSWYLVRYERPRTYAGYRGGPVTVVNQVFVARDRAAAEQLFQDQVKANERFPEAKEKVGDHFALAGADDIGDESRGLAACNGSCNSRKEIYLHQRIVTRVENAVSVVYVWGLSNPEGVTDESARHFAGLSAARVRG